MKYQVLKECGIDGVAYAGGELAEIPQGSVDSATRLGLIGPPIPDQPVEQSAAPSKADDPKPAQKK